MPPKRLRNYSDAAMLAAIEDVNRGMAYKTAARQHGVPRITLMDKHKGRVPIKAKMGAASVFSSEQEEQLVRWVRHMAKTGFPLSKETFLNSAGKLAKELKLKFGENERPGRKWLSLFLGRHPEISFRVSQNLTAMRRAVSQENINSWFKEVENYLKDNSLLEILEDRRRVFNTDETAFFLNPKPGKVLAGKGCKTVYTAAGNDEKFNLTVLLTANAEGQIAPPMVVYRYNRIPQIIAESFPSNWALGKSESGWMTHELFYEYMTNIFYPWVKSQDISFPIIFFMDGHTSHISLPLSTFCKERGIELVALYPNATHVLQPMDVAIFHSLKSMWRQNVQEWRMQNNGDQLKKHDFAPLLKSTLKKLTTTAVQNGFKKCGLSPWNPSQVKVEEDPTPLGSGCNKHRQKEKIFLLTLEKKIGKDKLNTFHQNEGDWNGPVEDHSLYKLWKQLKEDTSENGKEGGCVLEITEEVMDAEETILEEVNNRQEEQPMRHITELEESAVGISAQEKNIMHLEEEMVLEKMPSTSLQIPDPQEAELIENGINVTYSEETTPSKKNVSAASQDNQKPSTSKLEFIPSPFKRALLWPEPREHLKSKRRKEKLPAVVTSPQMLEYYKKKEMKKIEAEKLKEERKKLRESKKKILEEKKLKLKNKKQKIEESSDSSSEDEMSIRGSDDSMWEEKSDGEEEISKVVSVKDVKEGDFILVEFKGGKRMVSIFVYLCIIQKIISSSEIEIMGLRSTDATKKIFVPKENDISVISFNQIIGKTSNPNVVLTGERVSYQFSHSLQVKEM